MKRAWILISILSVAAITSLGIGYYYNNKTPDPGASGIPYKFLLSSEGELEDNYYVVEGPVAINQNIAAIGVVIQRKGNFEKIPVFVTTNQIVKVGDRIRIKAIGTGNKYSQRTFFMADNYVHEASLCINCQ